MLESRYFEDKLKNLKEQTHLSDSDIEFLKHNSFRHTYSRGENIHGYDGTCTGIIFINTGTVRVYIMSEEGKEVTLYRLYEGDYCMLSASCVLQTISFEVHVDAEADCDVFIISPSAFRELMGRNIYLENFALNITVSRFSEVMWAMQQVLFMNLDRRLAAFLYDEYVRTGDIQIRMTHEQIAKYIGSAREVISRMLKYLSKEGIVDVARGGITILDKEKLLSLI